MNELKQAAPCNLSRISEITDDQKDLSKSYSRLIIKNDNPEEVFAKVGRQQKHRYMENISRHKSVTKSQMQRIEDVIRHASDLNAILGQNRRRGDRLEGFLELKEKKLSIESLVAPETHKVPMQNDNVLEGLSFLTEN